MYDDMAIKLAKIMTEYSAPVKKGDVVVILSSEHTAPVVRALYEAVLRKGGHPLAIGSGVSGLGDLFFELADEDQLQFQDPVFRTVADEVNVLYSIWSRTNTKSMSRVDPQKLAMQQIANKPIRDRLNERERAGEYEWCILPWPALGDAQEAEMSLLAYTKFIYEACALHLDDPLSHWQAVRERQLKLVEYLDDKSEAVIKGPGIEMSLSLEGRSWVSAHGERNFPDGEIFTGPVENSVNGYVEFNMPSVYMGREVRGVRLVYKDGKIVEASAEKGEAFLLSQLDTDEGARRMGEFAIGTNTGIQEVTGSTLFDEKIGGTIHMAVGLSLPNTGGENESVVHWDMVHDMKDGGEIYVDGELFYQAGEFKV
jgi:aminopeptidase